jgi:hypothetical protein
MISVGQLNSRSSFYSVEAIIISIRGILNDVVMAR